MSQPRGGLGRGLGALIPRGGGMQEIDVERIAPSPQQPRQQVDQEQLNELAESLREHGVLQPLVVARAGDGGYVLVAGERRWRAARLAGLKTVPAVVKEASPRERLEWALVENLQRQDLGPLEAAAAYQQLVQEHGLTQEQVAQRVGKSRVAVANTLRLLSLPPAAVQALAAGKMSEGHARAILSCPGAEAQDTLLRAILQQGLTVRQAEEWSRRLTEASQPRPASTPRRLDPDLAAVEQRFREALGTKVSLQRGRKGGKLVVYFFSDEELQGLYQAICGDERDR
jgi:ParB family chromosome partitioning protein